MENYNYDNTQFSYYIQMACTSESAATTLITAAIATLTATFIF